MHGCQRELTDLLDALGYRPAADGGWRHPAGRTAVFLGDLVDRGPDTPGVLATVLAMTAAGTALCVSGNHESKLLRALRGRDVKVSHGLAESLAQLQAGPEEFRAQATAFLDGLISHYVLDGGRLVVAHAGLRQEMHGRASAAVRSFALYGETTGETDEFGLPVRYPWALDYRGKAVVVYGHTPVPVPVWVNNTICLDTGCVFGGRLTALRYPERELVSVPARSVYYQPARPLVPDGGATAEAGTAAGPAATAAARPANEPGRLLDIADVLGRRGIETRLRGRVSIPEENAAAALEVMSRFAVAPQWLIYLPPTMAPVPASGRPGVLEHPADALTAYRRDGVARVVCEEKHMGSRAVAVVCRTPAAARDWFGTEQAGLVYTRTGRRFFADTPMEEELLSRLRGAIEAAGLWDDLGDWAALDCEILPWSLKADELISSHYAAVGAAAVAGLGAAAEMLDAARARGLEVTGLRERTGQRRQAAESFVRAYRPYVWPVAAPRRRAAGAVPGPGGLGRHLLRPRSRVAHGSGRAAGRGRPADQGDPLSRGRSRRPRHGRGRDRMVGRAHRGRRRGNGGQAGRPGHPGQARPGPAGDQVPGPRVPADHLRAGILAGRQPGPAARAQPRAQAVAGRQ